MLLCSPSVFHGINHIYLHGHEMSTNKSVRIKSESNFSMEMRIIFSGSTGILITLPFAAHFCFLADKKEQIKQKPSERKCGE